MFCRKFKDLKITGECPFSLLAPGQVPTEPIEEVAGVSESCQATLPTCQEFAENAEGSHPQRKTSRNRVYLHTLAESIGKLIFPEFERLNLALQRTLAKHKIKENSVGCGTQALHVQDSVHQPCNLVLTSSSRRSSTPGYMLV